MKVTEKEEVAKKQDLTKDKDAKDAVKEVKETKDVDTLTFEGLDAVLIFFFFRSLFILKFV